MQALAIQLDRSLRNGGFSRGFKKGRQRTFGGLFFCIKYLLGCGLKNTFPRACTQRLAKATSRVLAEKDKLDMRVLQLLRSRRRQGRRRLFCCFLGLSDGGGFFS